MRVLIVEDDTTSRDALAVFLRGLGHAVDQAGSAEEALGLISVYPLDALLVDIGLPEGESAGLNLVRSVREAGATQPVVFLSGHSSLQDRLQAFDVGADDYVTKPYDLMEVAARLRAIARRAPKPDHRVLERGPLMVDWDSRCATINGIQVHLTSKEYGILELLATNRGRLFEREEIISRVWDVNFSADTNVVDVYVWNLRKKLGPGVIETVRGLGYRFPAH